SGLKATAWTQLVWPRRVWVFWPGPCQTVTVPAVLPQARRGASRSDGTQWAPPVAARKSGSSFAVASARAWVGPARRAAASAHPAVMAALSGLEHLGFAARLQLSLVGDGLHGRALHGGAHLLRRKRGDPEIETFLSEESLVPRH